MACFAAGMDANAPLTPERGKSRISHFRRAVVVTASTGAVMAAGGCEITAVSVNPPAPSCPAQAEPQGPCEQDGLFCDTGRTTGCGDIAVMAECRDGYWQDTGEVSCNPPPVDPQTCPPRAQLKGPCALEGQSCDTGEITGCDQPLLAICQDGRWLRAEISCNPPPPVFDAGCDAACPPAEQLTGACPEEGLTCDTGRTTGCGDVPLTATCRDGQWQTPELTCNPPPPEVDAGPFPDDACPTAVPDPDTACQGDQVCAFGLCILDWNAESSCRDGRWVVRYQNCFTGDWFTLGPDELE